MAETRFHFPAEHKINGVTYDAEFQIIGKDAKNLASYCAAHSAGLSLMIKVDDTQPDDFFSKWVGKTEFTFDLN